jgi:hypothetical protein
MTPSNQLLANLWEPQMTKPKPNLEPIGEILPGMLYRTTLCPVIFGYGPQRRDDLIEKEELPRPAPLSKSSRFEYWTGQQILDHRAAMRKLAEEKAAADKLRPAQPQPLALQHKIKKQKLRPPSKAVTS